MSCNEDLRKTTTIYCRSIVNRLAARRPTGSWAAVMPTLKRTENWVLVDGRNLDRPVTVVNELSIRFQRQNGADCSH